MGSILGYGFIGAFAIIGFCYTISLIVDLTHSLGKEEGRPNLTIAMARAAIAMGADGIFIETHPDPQSSKSDGKRMFPLAYMETLIKELIHL